MIDFITPSSVLTKMTAAEPSLVYHGVLVNHVELIFSRKLAVNILGKMAHVLVQILLNEKNKKLMKCF
jgi:hypothetical protein